MARHLADQTKSLLSGRGVQNDLALFFAFRQKELNDALATAQTWDVACRLQGQLRELAYISKELNNV